MKTVTILTTGSRGDVQPYLALGTGLKENGVCVRIASFSLYREMIISQGLEHFAVRGDLKQVIHGEQGLSAMQTDSPIKVALSFRKLQKLVFDLQEDFSLLFWLVQYSFHKNLNYFGIKLSAGIGL